MNHYVFLGLILVGIFSIMAFYDVYGLIEMKKYKVINSQDVCGDRLCSIADELRTKKGLSTHDGVCKNRPCYVNTDNRPVEKGASLTIEPFFISNQRYLLFKGQGWHNLHNVEVKMIGDEFKTSMRSQTDERGNLYMLWPIPRMFDNGSYNIFATDGIHGLELIAKIGTDGKVSVKTSKVDRCSSTKFPVDWSGCDLYGRVLTNVDLRMAKLRNANLYGATLVNKDLSGADLSGAVLKKTNLDGAILVGADLSYSNMIDAKVRGADLSSAKLKLAKLYRTDFSRSDLSDADFGGASMSYANLSFTDLKGANLEGAGTWAVNLNHCKNHRLCE